MIPRFLSALRETILQRYTTLTAGHTHCTYNSNPGAHDAIYFQPAKSLTPSTPPPIISWPTLSPSVPCSQQHWRSYNYTWMSPVCCNSFASLIFWRGRGAKAARAAAQCRDEATPLSRSPGLVLLGAPSLFINTPTKPKRRQRAFNGNQPVVSIHQKEDKLDISSSHLPLKTWF